MHDFIYQKKKKKTNPFELYVQLKHLHSLHNICICFSVWVDIKTMSSSLQTLSVFGINRKKKHFIVQLQMHCYLQKLSKISYISFLCLLFTDSMYYAAQACTGVKFTFNLCFSLFFHCTVLSFGIKDAGEVSKGAQTTARLLRSHGLHTGASSARLQV